MSSKLVKPLNQADLLAAALAPTNSTGFLPDAVAYALKRPDERLTAVAVFDGFTGRDARIHFAMLADVALTQSTIEAFLLAAFSPHPFCLNLEKLWAHIHSDNRRVVRAALAIGFDFEYRKRAGFGAGQDAIVLSMARTTPGGAAARSQATKRADPAQEA